MLSAWFIVALHLIPLLKGSTAADPYIGPDPNGDMLVVFNGYTPICLAAALANNTKDAKGRIYQRGDIYAGACRKTPNEIWLVHNDNGTTSLRLKSNSSLCLTMNNEHPRVRMTPCGQPEYFQRQTIEFRNRRNEEFHICGFVISVWLRVDASNQSFDIRQHAPRLLDRWTWMSPYERMAEPVRNTSLVFPPSNETGLERAQYRAAMIDQLVNGTLYPPINMTPDACSDCKEACECFPIDYHLTRLGSKTINLDLTLNTDVGPYGIIHGPRNLVASGMYAKPGQEFIIELGKYNQQKAEINVYLFLVDGLNEKEIWRRPSELTAQHTLAPGINKVRSPYGGPIILDVARRDPGSGVIKATIRDAAPMATFILDETTEESWTKELEKEPGWFVYQAKYSAGLDLKKPYTNATFDQVRTMVMRYELMIMNAYLLNGHDFDAKPGSTHAVPNGWYWWIRDSSKEFIYAGNPIKIAKAKGDGDISLIWKSVYMVRIYAHEFGHAFTPCLGLFGLEVMADIQSNFQRAYFCTDGKMSSTCPGKSGSISYYSESAKNIRNKLVSNPRYAYSKMNFADATVFWLQIFSKYGYDSYRRLNRRLREKAQNKATNICHGTEQQKIDAVYETLSEMVGEDLTKHFDTYRLPLSKEARQRVNERALPKPPVDLINLNIFEGTPLTWNPKGPVPPYALPPYLQFEEMQGGNYTG